MSKVILIASLAGTVPYHKECAYIGIDRGAYIAMKQQIPLLCAIGDFDSISEHERIELSDYTDLIVLPEQKNETDSEAAIKYALEKGYDDIMLYGCFGGRIDHTMANMSLLIHRNYPLTLADEDNEARILMPGKYTISNKYRHLSFLALETSVISETGVAYPLCERNISEKDIYTVSNRITAEQAQVVIHSGRVLLMQSNSK